MRYALFLAVLGIGCYAPSTDALRCKYQCGAGGDCPTGLVCNSASNMCAASSDDACTNTALDGGPDGLVPECDWPDTSNVNACSYASRDTGIDWNVEGTTLVDIQSGDGLPEGLVPIPVTVGTIPMHILVVDTLTVTPSASLVVDAQRPLVILARGDVTIDGVIELVPTALENCSNVTGGSSTDGGGGGGGGGGFGMDGMSGGMGAIDNGIAGGGTAGQGGTAFAVPGLVPLLAGCPGGSGGASGSIGTRPGGAGGGAIQISSRSSITMDGGVIAANGGGGSQGTGGDDATRCAGGGGGGSGGAILLEAPRVTFVGEPRLCAVGGSGGGMQGAGRGASTSCERPLGGAGIMGEGGLFDSQGGDGAQSPAQAARPGTGVTMPRMVGRSGGGGGGGAGLVHVRRSVSPGGDPSVYGVYSNATF